MANINKYIKALLYPAGGHQGSHKAHQAGNQSYCYYIVQRIVLRTLLQTSILSTSFRAIPSITMLPMR